MNGAFALPTLRIAERHRGLQRDALAKGPVEDRRFVHIDPHPRDADARVTFLQLFTPPVAYLFACVVGEKRLVGPAVAAKTRPVRVFDKHVLGYPVFGGGVPVEVVFNTGVENRYGANAVFFKVA